MSEIRVKRQAIELFDEDAPPPGARVLWKHAGVEIPLMVRAVPPSVRSRFERSVIGNIKTGKARDQVLSKTGEQAREITALVAGYALLHAEEPFDLTTSSKATCAAMTEAGVPMTPGQVVTLAPTVEAWSAEVKAALFEKLPSMAAFVAEAADKVAGIERDQEAELGKT